MGASIEKISNIFGLIVVLAIIAVVLGSKYTAGDVKALGSVFTNSIRAATGH